MIEFASAIIFMITSQCSDPSIIFNGALNYKQSLFNCITGAIRKVISHYNFAALGSFSARLGRGILHGRRIPRGITSKIFSTTLCSKNLEQSFVYLYKVKGAVEMLSKSLKFMCLLKLSLTNKKRKCLSAVQRLRNMQTLFIYFKFASKENHLEKKRVYS